MIMFYVNMDCQKIWGGGEEEEEEERHGKEGMYMELSYCYCYFILTWLVYHLLLYNINK